MSILERLHNLELANGLKLCIFNQTKVYFGDYHRVRVTIVCSPRETSAESSAAPYSRTLEKMGVPSLEVNSVIDSLLKDFEKNSLPYLSAADFPQKLIENLHSKKGPVTRKFLGARS